MSGYSANSATGRVVAVQQDTIWTPRTPRTGTCGLILLPGSGNPRAYMDLTSQPASVRLAGALASTGIPTITCDFHGNSWGNDNAQSAIDTAWVVLKAAFPAMRTDKVCLLGGSMGAGAVARWSQLHPANTAAVVGLIPAYDIKGEYTDIPALVAAIETAWGFSGLGAYPAGADTRTNAAAAAGIPILTGYASNDTTVPPARSIDYHQAVGGTADNLLDLGALGHSDAAIAAMPIATVARFLVANGA